MEGLRPRRHHHLGGPADRLPVGRPGPARVRTPWLPTGRGVLLVHLLPHPGPLPVRPRRAAGDVPRGQGPAARPRARLGRRGRRPRAPPPLPPGPRQGWARPGLVAGGGGDRGSRARAHDQDLRSRPVHRLLPDPGHVDGVALHRHPLHPADRRGDDIVLRLVRRPPRGQPAGVRRSDRRAGVRRLVGRDVPDDVGLQRPGDPDTGRALDGRGALPRARRS